MTTHVLIIDPDISFTVPVKRALEQNGDYAVSVFASVQAALDFSRREAPDVVILDFGIENMTIPEAIQALRQIRSSVFILVSPRTHDQVAQVPSLDIQGSIIKPYFARQIAAIIKETASSRAKRIDQPPDTSFPYSAGPSSDDQIVASSALLDEPPIPDDATVGDLVTGLVPVVSTSGSTAEGATNSATTESSQNELAESETARSTAPEADILPLLPDIPESPDQPSLATLALETANDDTMPFDRISVQALIQQVEKPTGYHIDLLPPWLRKSVENTDPHTVVGPDIEPSFVASIPDPVADAANDTAASSHTTKVAPESSAESTASDTSAPFAATFVEPPHIGAEVHDELQSDGPPILDLQTDPSLTSDATSNPGIASESPVAERNLSEGPEQTEATSQALPENLGNSGSSDVITPEAIRESSSTEAEQPVSDSIAKLAVQLTQASVNSTAQTTILSRDDKIVASAGSFSDDRLTPIWMTIKGFLQNSDSEVKLRFIHVTNEGDFLLFSTRTLDDMMLSMLFAADTPIKVIRRQVQQLKTALENVPEGQALSVDEPEAARTLPSRPTGLRPPDGLREKTHGADQPEVSAPPPEVTYTSYSFVWLPRVPNSLDPVVGSLVGWLTDIAIQHHWKLDGTEIQAAYVALQISIPANETPTTAVEVLKREAAARAENPTIWAESYYLAASGRPVTQQEIANYLEFQRDTTS